MRCDVRRVGFTFDTLIEPRPLCAVVLLRDLTAIGIRSCPVPILTVGLRSELRTVVGGLVDGRRGCALLGWWFLPVGFQGVLWWFGCLVRGSVGLGLGLGIRGSLRRNANHGWLRFLV